jgi:hypothetical protein
MWWGAIATPVPAGLSGMVDGPRPRYGHAAGAEGGITSAGNVIPVLTRLRRAAPF